MLSFGQPPSPSSDDVTYEQPLTQIALEPPFICQMGKRGKRVPQTIQASLYAPPPPLRARLMYGNNAFQKGLPSPRVNPKSQLCLQILLAAPLRALSRCPNLIFSQGAGTCDGD